MKTHPRARTLVALFFSAVACALQLAGFVSVQALGVAVGSFSVYAMMDSAMWVLFEGLRLLFSVCFAYSVFMGWKFYVGYFNK
jgi:hypothetical protein